MKFIVLAFMAVLGSSAFATISLCRGFMPKNDMNIPAPQGEFQAAAATGITQTQFNDVLDRVDREYSSLIARKGGVFQIERLWNDGTVNAYADRDGNKWIIHMYGGMARHPAITYDGFAAVACHETGHHLGGAPIFTGANDWASVEGEADYYSMLKCLKRLFEKDDNAKILAGRKLDPTAVKVCTDEERSKADELLCIRATMAGISLANVLSDLESGAKPKLTTPDPRRVSRTYEDHPRAQCRLDTYFQGALCRENFNTDMSNSNYHTGACTDAHIYDMGFRPRCWFKPN